MTFVGIGTLRVKWQVLFKACNFQLSSTQHQAPKLNLPDSNTEYVPIVYIERRHLI